MLRIHAFVCVKQVPFWGNNNQWNTSWIHCSCHAPRSPLLEYEICNKVFIKTSHSHLILFFSRMTWLKSCAMHFNFGKYSHFEINFVCVPIIEVHKVKKKYFYIVNLMSWLLTRVFKVTMKDTIFMIWKGFFVIITCTIY